MLTAAERRRSKVGSDILARPTKDIRGKYIQVDTVDYSVVGLTRNTVERHEYLAPDGTVGYQDILTAFKGAERFLFTSAHVGPKKVRVGVWIQAEDD